MNIFRIKAFPSSYNAKNQRNFTIVIYLFGIPIHGFTIYDIEEYPATNLLKGIEIVL